MRFQGKAYRAHNPEWSWSSLSGEGARIHGGRFNRKGRAALYLSLDVLTAIREASPLGQPFHPLTFCEYDVDCAPIADLRKPATPKQLSITDEDVACPSWRADMLAGLVPRSHALAERFIASGCAGMIVRSFARGVGEDASNIVLWTWGPDPPSLIKVFDPQHRLQKSALSKR